jgi:hypothetical protein
MIDCNECIPGESMCETCFNAEASLWAREIRLDPGPQADRGEQYLMAADLDRKRSKGE